jgi:hypothetical protein
MIQSEHQSAVPRPLFETLEDRRLLSATAHAAAAPLHATRAKPAIDLVGGYAGTSTVRGLGTDLFTFNITDQSLIGQIGGTLVGSIDHTPAQFSGIFNHRKLIIFWNEGGVQMRADATVNSIGTIIRGKFLGVLAGEKVSGKFVVARPDTSSGGTTV